MKNLLLSLCAVALLALFSFAPAHAQPGFQICAPVANAAPNCAPVDSSLGLTIAPAGLSYSNITTATTTTIKSGAGVLHSLCINKTVASATVTIYDNTAASGSKIGTITLPATLLQEGGTGCDVFDVGFAIGLTIVTVGAQDITVSWR